MRWTLLVTVEGPQRAVDVELPGDVPISQLLPLLQELCAIAEPHRDGKRAGFSWSLCLARGARPLSAEFSLFEHGVLDGDVLLVQAGSMPSASVACSEQRIRKEILPSELTGGIGVTWKKESLL